MAGISFDISVYDSSSMDNDSSFLFPCTGQTKFNKFDNTVNTRIFSFLTEFETDSSQTESNRTVFQFNSPSKSYSNVNEGRYIWQRYQRTSYSRKFWKRIPKEQRASSAFCSTRKRALPYESNAAVCPTPTPVGNALKFNAPTGIDVGYLDGKSINIRTRKQCITCMSEYGNKSLEELRLEHYADNRKRTQGGLFEGQRGASFISNQEPADLSFGASSTSGANIKFIGRTTSEIAFNEGNFHERPIRFQSITEEYGDKSFEELRVEEYLAGHKSPQYKINSSEDNSEEKKFFGATNFVSNPKNFQRKMFDFNKNTQTGYFGTPNSSSAFLFAPTQAKSFLADTSKETTKIFRPPEGTDTILRGGVPINTRTRLQCITCMPEYESKSLEELMLEDNRAIHKGPQRKTCGYDKIKETGFFGNPNSSFSSHFGSILREPFPESSPSFNTLSRNGTSLKFHPPTGTDIMMRGGGVQTDTRTRLQCISCMIEYDSKSLEELRLEDYQSNRKGPQHETCGFDKIKETGFFGNLNSSFSSHFGSILAEPFSENTPCFNVSSNGTSLKFKPRTGTDTMMRGEVQINTRTRFQCITCTMEYDSKSLEELRLEDYQSNRKGPQHKTCGFDKIQETRFFGNPTSSFSSHFGSKLAEPFAGSIPCFSISCLNGTPLKFKPYTGTDTMISGGFQINTWTRLQCITCMTEYESKSLEELRLEDYRANRICPQYNTCDYDKSKDSGFFEKSNSSFGFKLAEPFSGSISCFSISPPNGTPMKFKPPTGIDNKSLEELKLKDYKVNLIGLECGIGNSNGCKEIVSSMFSNDFTGSSHWTWKSVYNILKSLILDKSTPSGTTTQFNPLKGMDVKMKNVPVTVFTRHQCITCMPEYENKSFEELRMEDYAANRREVRKSTITSTAEKIRLVAVPIYAIDIV